MPGLLQRLAEELNLPMLYVSHDIEEVSQLADHLLLLDQGQLTGQGSLLELCSRLDTRSSHEEQAAAIAQCTIARHDADFGLTELDLEGQPLLVSHFARRRGNSAGCASRPAMSASAASAPQASSILNILPVTLAEIEETANARVLLRLALGSQILLARITRKSAHRTAIDRLATTCSPRSKVPPC